MLREEKQTVVKAISDLGFRVTAADVASKSGLPLAATNRLLNTIASETGGHLEVSEAGDIAYRFKSNFQGVYLATGIKAIFQQIFQKLFIVVFYLVKISFGIALILSLFVVVIVFIVIAVLSSNLSNDREDYSLSELVQFFNLLIVRDLLFWGTGNLNFHERKKIRRQENTKKLGKGNFFTNCFSFLFGDGDPNLHLEEEKWHLAAQAIRKSGGVVIKEQLAPFIGPDIDDEDRILPVLSRFDGEPRVTASGNIAYIFPSLQVTSDIEHMADRHEENVYLKEKQWQFSHVSAAGLKPVYVVAGLNLFGTWWLFFVLQKMLHFNWGWLQLMVIYGTLFVAIPAIRYLWQSSQNQEIIKRNMRRQTSAENLAHADQELAAKLAERAEFESAVALRQVESEHLLYTTEQESLEQIFEKKENE